MIVRLAILLVINYIHAGHSFSTNVGHRVCNLRISKQNHESHLPTLPYLRQNRCKKYQSSLHLFLKGRDKRTIDVERKSESIRSENQEEKIISSSFRRLNNGLPWERESSNNDGNKMGDLSRLLHEPGLEEIEMRSTVDYWKEEASSLSLSQVVSIGAVVVLLGVPIALDTLGLSVDPSEMLQNVQDFFADPTTSLQLVAETVKSMGPLGALYFGVIYTIAEVLAIPAIPLTASAGYLFGVTTGTAIVLLSASIAASIGFILGRTFLRTYVERILEDKPEFKRIDRAIGQEGFKVILLLRLSPLFPFSLSNYLYGVTSVRFWPYFFGTMLGFAPGTIAYVYTGEIGKALTIESGTAEPWYVYAGGLILFSGLLKIVADVATGIIKSLEEDDET